jgi:hypothetical protein
MMYILSQSANHNAAAAEMAGGEFQLAHEATLRSIFLTNQRLLRVTEEEAATTREESERTAKMHE